MDGGGISSGAVVALLLVWVALFGLVGLAIWRGKGGSGGSP